MGYSERSSRGWSPVKVCVPATKLSRHWLSGEFAAAMLKECLGTSSPCRRAKLLLRLQGAHGEGRGGDSDSRRELVQGALRGEEDRHYGRGPPAKAHLSTNLPNTLTQETVPAYFTGWSKNSLRSVVRRGRTRKAVRGSRSGNRAPVEAARAPRRVPHYQQARRPMH